MSSIGKSKGFPLEQSVAWLNIGGKSKGFPLEQSVLRSSIGKSKGFSSRAECS